MVRSFRRIRECFLPKERVNTLYGKKKRRQLLENYAHNKMKLHYGEKKGC
jgi:hypothetical protein